MMNESRHCVGVGSICFIYFMFSLELCYHHDYTTIDEFGD